MFFLCFSLSAPAYLLFSLSSHSPLLVSAVPHLILITLTCFTMPFLHSFFSPRICKRKLRCNYGSVNSWMTASGSKQSGYVSSRSAQVEIKCKQNHARDT
ncbi:hypothetical protein AMECASPLE_001744 [Ameca splendens]|uniref:Secreted protein n=1 Tax=Ameca splendens TaxID=208324 RepID=A0ABV0ZVF5_9TELE